MITVYVVLGFKGSFMDIVGLYDDYSMATEFIEEHEKVNKRRQEQGKSCAIYDMYVIESHYLVRKGEKQDD